MSVVRLDEGWTARLFMALSAIAVGVALAVAAVSAVYFTRPNQEPARGWVSVDPGSRARCIGGVLVVQMDDGGTITEPRSACEYVNGPAVTP